MAAPPSPRAPAAPRRRRDQAVVLAGVVTIVGTAMAMAVWFAGAAAPDDHRAADPDPRAPDPPPAVTQDPAAPPVADPASVRVASRGIEADTIALGKHADGSLEVPESAHTAGWWTGGAKPGARGASVIVGHVDSRQGPGAFFGLVGVAPGERVTVRRTDGSSAHFRVERVETHPKDAFPTEVVYGHTDTPTLRLVTCAGRFDPAARSYEDNVIVFADLEADEAPVEAGVPGGAPVGAAGGADGPDAASSPATVTPAHDGRRVPIGLATFSVMGTAAAVTGRALQCPQRTRRPLRDRHTVPLP